MRKRAGWAASGLVLAFLVFVALLKLIAPKAVTDSGADLGFASVAANRQLGAILLLCSVIHAIPRTRVLGALLLTAYLGGTVATQMRVHAPVFGSVLFGAYLGVLMWAGMWLRDERIRELVPLSARTSPRCRSDRPA